MIHRAINRLQNHRDFLARQLMAAKSLAIDSRDQRDVVHTLTASLELSILELDRALVELSHISPSVPDNGGWIEP
jgi:DnaJ-domain-containing protein 1